MRSLERRRLGRGRLGREKRHWAEHNHHGVVRLVRIYRGYKTDLPEDLLLLWLSLLGGMCIAERWIAVKLEEIDNATLRPASV